MRLLVKRGSDGHPASRPGAKTVADVAAAPGRNQVPRGIAYMLGSTVMFAGGNAVVPSVLAGMLFDDDGNRMTPSHAVKQGTRYRYYVSHRLITKDQTEMSAGQRIPAGEIEHLVTGRVRQWLLDSGSIYQATRLSDPSTQRGLIARAAEIGKSWTELPGTRQRAFLTALFDRIDVGANRI